MITKHNQSAGTIGFKVNLRRELYPREGLTAQELADKLKSQGVRIAEVTDKCVILDDSDAKLVMM